MGWASEPDVNLRICWRAEAAIRELLGQLEKKTLALAAGARKN